MSRLKIIMLALLGVVLAVALVLGMWLAGWWFTGQNVNKSAHINRTSYEAQKTYRDQIQRDMTVVANVDVQIVTPSNASMVDALKAQRLAVVNQICQIATNLTTSDVNPSELKFITLNCPEGTLP